MGDDEDGEDYMSDSFLQRVADVKPGLLSREQKRKIKTEMNPAVTLLSKRKKYTAVEKETRQEGLATPIDSDNKGFALLQKMGYKKGTGIGKLGDGGTTLIPLVVRDGRIGLGRETFLKEKQTLRVVAKQTRDERVLNEFVHRKQQTQALKIIELDLERSQKACEQLDTQAGHEAPTVLWFWPEVVLTAEEEDTDKDESEEETEVGEKLVQLTEYLRNVYFYCTWCGTSYNSEEDLAQNCPGDTKESHD